MESSFSLSARFSSAVFDVHLTNQNLKFSFTYIQLSLGTFSNNYKKALLLVFLLSFHWLLVSICQLDYDFNAIFGR